MKMRNLNDIITQNVTTGFVKQTRKLTLLITFLLINLISIGQNCNVDGKKDWQKVEVRLLTQASPPEGFKLIGEWAMKGVGSVGSITKIKERHLKQIKQKTADGKSCIVYVDVNGIMNCPGRLYYYYGYEKN